MNRRFIVAVGVVFCVQVQGQLVQSLQVQAQEVSITLVSTTSTEQSGLFEHIIPIFRKRTGIVVRVVAVGTGQAFQIAARGDADALLVHDRAGEEAFIVAGHGLDRRDVMFNDYVIVGPVVDPAGVKGSREAGPALARIAASNATFLSRGDDSGTHRRELTLWRQAGLQTPSGHWYREVGQGMGPTLNMAASLNGYTLTDRATWASFRNRQSLQILVEGDRSLFNPYSSIVVNPAKGAHIKAEAALRWHSWLTSDEGHAAIASFRINGEQLFFTTGQGAAVRSGS
ncbi:MAG: substrate-binding domain-containing protein [Bosea sp. (in: a-proteobacteria)]